jgi:hypothetical protein
MVTAGNYNAHKLVENHIGIAHMKLVGTVAVQVPGIPFQAPTPSRNRWRRIKPTPPNNLTF